MWWRLVEGVQRVDGWGLTHCRKEGRSMKRKERSHAQDRVGRRVRKEFDLIDLIPLADVWIWDGCSRTWVSFVRWLDQEQLLQLIITVLSPTRTYCCNSSYMTCTDLLVWENIFLTSSEGTQVSVFQVSRSLLNHSTTVLIYHSRHREERKGEGEEKERGRHAATLALSPTPRLVFNLRQEDAHWHLLVPLW